MNLKMTDNTQQKLADSFSEGMLQLSLTRLDSIYSASKQSKTFNFGNI